MVTVTRGAVDGSRPADAGDGTNGMRALTAEALVRARAARPKAQESETLECITQRLCAGRSCRSAQSWAAMTVRLRRGHVAVSAGSSTDLPAAPQHASVRSLEAGRQAPVFFRRRAASR